MPRVDVQHPDRPTEWNRWFTTMEEAERYLKHITEDRGMIAQLRPEITPAPDPRSIGNLNIRIKYRLVPFIEIEDEEHP